MCGAAPARGDPNQQRERRVRRQNMRCDSVIQGGHGTGPQGVHQARHLLAQSHLEVGIPARRDAREHIDRMIRAALQPARCRVHYHRAHRPADGMLQVRRPARRQASQQFKRVIGADRMMVHQIEDFLVRIKILT